MQLVVLADDILKEELLSNGKTSDAEIAWLETAEEFSEYKNADIYCDLLFDASAVRIEILKNITQPVIINSVDKTLNDLHASFIRINAWPGFLKGSHIEASCHDESKMKQAEIFFSTFNKKMEWLPDEAGFVTARVVAMIINEAYFALGEGVSEKTEIDIAMKLGTNYPYGPFEWCDKIGVEKIYSLLTRLSKTNSRYKPATFLEKEAFS
jgi:3-hydroxybutyryl-CoA dehydrogenase